MEKKVLLKVFLLIITILNVANAQEQIASQPGQTSSMVDTCLLGCVTSAVTNVGVTNLRPSSWSWKLTDLLQSAVMRSICQAFDQARTCLNSCSFSASKLMVSGLMGVPSILCTGSPGARDCLQNVSRSMQNTCDNKCRDMKPSFSLSTWASVVKMGNIFNDMCSYWGCQIACEKPAVDRQCNEEAKGLMSRLSSIGLNTLKNALKSAGLTSVCGANATRIPNTPTVVTEGPTDDGGGGGGQDNGQEGQRPPVDGDGEEDNTGGGTDAGTGGFGAGAGAGAGGGGGASGGGGGRPGGLGGGGGGGGGGRPGGLGGGAGGGGGGRPGGLGGGAGAGGGEGGTAGTGGLGGGSAGGFDEDADGDMDGGTGISPSHGQSGRPGQHQNANTVNSGGNQRSSGGSGRGKGRGRVTTPSVADVHGDGSDLGDEDYWQAVRSGGRRGSGSGSGRGSGSGSGSEGGVARPSEWD